MPCCRLGGLFSGHQPFKPTTASTPTVRHWADSTSPCRIAHDMNVIPSLIAHSIPHSR